MNSKGRNNKSLGENSMKVVANMVKLSAFSIAKMSLGASAAAKTAGPITDSVTLSESHYRKNSSNPVSFLMEPNKGNEDKSVIDDKASAYIWKVHQKNLSDWSKSSNLPQNILPPPPYAAIQSPNQ